MSAATIGVISNNELLDNLLKNSGICHNNSSVSTKRKTVDMMPDAVDMMQVNV